MTKTKQLEPFRSRKTLALFAVMMLCPVFFFAHTKYTITKYTISGVVRGVANGETLLGATVLLKGTSIGSTTNEYGFYSITAPEGNYALTTSYLGFTTFERALETNEYHHIFTKKYVRF